MYPVSLAESFISSFQEAFALKRSFLSVRFPGGTRGGARLVCAPGSALGGRVSGGGNYGLRGGGGAQAGPAPAPRHTPFRFVIPAFPHLLLGACPRKRVAGRARTAAGSKSHASRPRFLK